MFQNIINKTSCKTQKNVHANKAAYIRKKKFKKMLNHDKIFLRVSKFKRYQMKNSAACMHNHIFRLQLCNFSDCFFMCDPYEKK